MNETPIQVTQEQVDELYGDDLIIESVSLDEVINTHFEGLAIHQPLMLEAITSKRNRIEQTMKAFNRKFKSALSGTNVDSEEAEISKPRKAAGFAIMAAKFPLSDGQSVSIIFHAPDEDPSKILPNDTLVAFRFLLNKRDVTHVVAPSGGHDIALNQVVMALSNLVERNSKKFQNAQAGKKKKAEELKVFQDGVEAFEAKKEVLSAEIEKAEEQIASTESRAESLKSLVVKQVSKNAKLRAQLAAASKKAEADKAVSNNYVSDKIIAVASKMTKIEFVVWAKDNLSLDIDSAGELFDQAKGQMGQVSQNLATENKDEVLNNVKTMVLSEFTRWAKDALKMNAYDAEVLYNDVEKQLQTELTKKLESQNAFKLIKQIEAALAAERSGLKVKAASVQINSADLVVRVGDAKIYATLHDRENKAYIITNTDSDSASNTDMIYFDYGITELPSDLVSQVTTSILKSVDVLTPKNVDINDLPEEGSRSNDVNDAYGAKLSALIRSAINTEIKKRFSYPDKSFKISVTKGSSGKSVRVNVLGAPKELQAYSNEYLSIDPSDYQGQQRLGSGAYTVEFNAVKNVIESAVNQFKEHGEYDPSADYGTPVNFYSSISYDFLNLRLREEEKAFNESLVDEKEVAKEEAVQEESNGEGANYVSGLGYKEVAKAVRKAIADKAKDSASNLFGGKYAVKSGLSTNKPFIAVTIKQVGQVELIDVKTDIEALLKSYNKVTGSAINDDVFMSFLPIVETDITVEKLFWYGLKARPLMVGSAPDKPVEQALSATEAKRKFSDVHENSVRHGAVAYAEKLTADDISKYELVDLATPEEDKLLSSSIVKKAIELGAKVELINGRYMALLGGERYKADATDSDDTLNLQDEIEAWVESQVKDTAKNQYWYGMVYRPLSIGVAHSKRDLVVQMLTKDEAINAFPNTAAHNLEHGAVAYSQKLTDSEVKAFEFYDLSVSDEQEYDDEYLLTTDVAQDAIKLGAKITLNNGVYTAKLGDKTLTANYENQEEIVTLHDEIEAWAKSQEVKPSTVDGGEPVEEKPEPKPWGNFTVPMIPNLAQGHIPEHFNLVQAVDEGRNIVKITSSKYDKLSATIEPVMAGEAEMYLIDPQEHTGIIKDLDGLKLALKRAVNTVIKHHYNGVDPAKEIEEVAKPSTVDGASDKVEVAADYGEFTPYKGTMNGNDVWFVNDKLPSGKVSQMFFPNKEDAEKSAKFLFKQDQVAKDREKEIEIEKQQEKAQQDAFDAEYSDIGGQGDTPMQRGKRIKKLSSPVNLKGKVDSLKNHVDNLVSQGYTVKTIHGETGLASKDDSFFSMKDLGKFAMEYAEHLQSKNPAPEQEEKLSVIDKLKAVMTETTDPDALIEALEAAMDEVERTDQMDEYEPLLEQASDRVTELLEQQ